MSRKLILHNNNAKKFKKLSKKNSIINFFYFKYTSISFNPCEFSQNFLTYKIYLLESKFTNIEYIFLAKFYITLKKISGDRTPSYVVFQKL